MRFERSLSSISKDQSSGDQHENGSTIWSGADYSSSAGIKSLSWGRMMTKSMCCRARAA
jgi:hypothetical protein